MYIIYIYIYYATIANKTQVQKGRHSVRNARNSRNKNPEKKRYSSLVSHADLSVGKGKNTWGKIRKAANHRRSQSDARLEVLVCARRSRPRDLS